MGKGFLSACRKGALKLWTLEDRKQELVQHVLGVLTQPEQQDSECKG